MEKRLDLRGLTCPEPVLRTKRILDDSAIERVHALVDDDVCVNNLTRLSRSLKAVATAQKLDGYYEVIIERFEAGDRQARREPAPFAVAEPGKVGTVIFLAKDTFGEGEPDFSRTLINLFLQSILDSGHLPRAILLANTGVKLLAPGAGTNKVLEDFRSRGCEVLACGLCVDFYGLKEYIAAEQVTNMFAIVEYLFAADKVLSP